MKKREVFHSLFILLSIFLWNSTLPLYSQIAIGAETDRPPRTLTLQDQDLSNYADFLYQSREYYRSISEYKKLIYFFPDGEPAQRAKIQIGRAYMAGGDQETAIEYWEQLLKEKGNEKYYLNIKTLLGISWLDKKQASVFTIRQPYIEKALEHFSTLKRTNRESEYILDFVDDWKARETPDYKSPLLAGALSAIIPGSGSFYSKRYVEGTYAFLITTLFYLAAQESFKDNKREAGYFFSFFALSFYGGNIYTAINSVHKINDNMDTAALLDFRKKHGIWLIPKGFQTEGRF